jgi:hypothetical protein
MRRSGCRYRERCRRRAQVAARIDGGRARSLVRSPGRRDSPAQSAGAVSTRRLENGCLARPLQELENRLKDFVRLVRIAALTAAIAFSASHPLAAQSGGPSRALSPDTDGAALCSAIERQIDSRDGLDSDKLDYSPVEPTPASMGDDGPYQAAPVTLHGRRVQLAESVGMGTCFDIDLSIWSEDFAERLAEPVRYGDEDGGYGKDSLLLINGWPYFLSVGRYERVARVTRIERDFKTTLICEGGRTHREPERVIQSSDQKLCNAAAVGTVKPISLHHTTLSSRDLANDPAWSAYFDDEHLVTPAGRDVIVEGTLDADISNDGHLRHLLWLRNHDGSSGGCGEDWTLEWPVVVDAAGRPSMDDPIRGALRSVYQHAQSENRLFSRTAISERIFRYQGHILIDVRSPFDGDEPVHQIWRIRNGRPDEICKLIPTIVRLAPPPP